MGLPPAHPPSRHCKTRWLFYIHVIKLIEHSLDANADSWDASGAVEASAGDEGDWRDVHGVDLVEPGVVELSLGEFCGPPAREPLGSGVGSVFGEPAVEVEGVPIFRPISSPISSPIYGAGDGIGNGAGAGFGNGFGNGFDSGPDR